jgi:hypothetical protein
MFEDNITTDRIIMVAIAPLIAVVIGCWVI